MFSLLLLTTPKTFGILMRGKTFFLQSKRRALSGLKKNVNPREVEKYDSLIQIEAK